MDTGKGLESGVKPQATVQKGRTGGIAAAVVGYIWAFLASAMAVNMFVQGTALGYLAGILGALSALFAVPPVVEALRRRLAVLKPAFVPPVLAVALAMIAANVGPKIPTPELGRSQLPPAKELTLQETLAQARSALDQGDHDAALKLLTGLPEWQQTGDADVAGLQKRAFDMSKAAELPAQVRDNWLPEIAALNVPGEEEDIASIWAVVQAFEDWGRQIETASTFPLDEAGRAALQEAKSTLSRRQAKLFPQLRRLWRQKVAHGFWLMDIDVAVSGRDARTVTWTGALFAANAHIQTSQASFVEAAQNLRFGTAHYRWFSGADRVTSYDMKPPSDAAVGYWNGGAFVADD